MHTEKTSSGAPGFGRNSNGVGIAIIAIVAIVLALLAWWLWNNGHKETEFYRLKTNNQAHDDHGSTTAAIDPFKGAAHLAAGKADPAIFGKVDTKGNFIYVLGDSIALRLPDSTILKVPNNSTEAKLLTFLIDDRFQVDTINKTLGWITCDQIFFETAKDSINEQSHQQIVHLASILNAFPNATIKVGGYTDNTGDSMANMKLSGDRAKMVAELLKSFEVSAAALAHEGYGSQWPLASNDTPEGRAMNRRVDIRVTKK